MVKETLTKCNVCHETRIEMEYEHLQMMAYMCPGCGTIRVVDHRGEFPDDVEKLPGPFVEYLRLQIAV